MKKNFIKAANALMFGAFAMSSLSLASCADDNELNNTAKQEVAQAASSKELEGMFTGTISDTDFMKDVNAIVSGNSLTLNVGTDKTGFTSATAKLTCLDDGKTLNGEFDKPIMDIKTFKFSKVGSYFFKMECVGTDGSTKEIGFFKTLATRAVEQNGELELSYLKGVANKSLEALMELVPGGKIIGGPIAEMLFADEKKSDMSVSDCYDKLSQAIQEVSLQVYEFQSVFKEETSMDRINAHEELRSRFEVPTRNCVNEIISLTQSDNPAAQESINNLIKAWGADNAKDARQFICQTMNGVSANSKPYSSIIDGLAEKKFAWEHQGYYFREMYRMREIACVAECAAMLAAYGEVESMSKDPNLGNYLNNIVEKFKANEVVVDNEHAICQIPGAHHLKIDKKTIYPFQTACLDRNGKVMSMFNLPYIEAKEDLGFLVVPVYNKDRDYATNPEFIKERDAMMTVSEAKAIVSYYGYQKSMCDILEKEAGLHITPCHLQERILLLYGTNSFSKNEKHDRMESGGNVQYRTKDIGLETVCYFDKAKEAFYSLHIGTVETKWVDFGNYRVPPFYYNEWRTHDYNNYEYMKLAVAERDNKWNPGNYF